MATCCTLSLSMGEWRITVRVWFAVMHNMSITCTKSTMTNMVAHLTWPLELLGQQSIESLCWITVTSTTLHQTWVMQPVAWPYFARKCNHMKYSSIEVLIPSRSPVLLSTWRRMILSTVVLQLKIVWVSVQCMWELPLDLAHPHEWYLFILHSFVRIFQYHPNHHCIYTCPGLELSE